MLVLGLSISSICIYFIQIKIFHKPDDTLFYLFQDLAFIPVQAIIVTIILNKLLNVIETRHKLKKINVIISAFFSETGTSILFSLAKLHDNHNFCKLFDISDINNKEKFKILKKQIKELDNKISFTTEKFDSLRCILAENKSYMIAMLGNSNLSEHDSFTDMLWSVFHVADELGSRATRGELSEADIVHLKTDIKRAYTMMLLEWVNYLKYLNDEYPYLFNMAIRKNPFSEIDANKSTV
jgi:hypothetical protein